MRIVKEADERKKEILDVAEILFKQKGYDGTSTNDILEKVGIARGTLYYHFKSKEDIMDALIERYNGMIIEKAEAIGKDKSIPVYERILGVVMALNISEGGGDEIFEHIHKPQNALMHQKTQKVIVCGIPPILAEVIQDGIAEGLFNTPYPYECMEMVIAYANTIFDRDLVEMTPEEQGIRIQAFVFNLERMLGAEAGSLGQYVMQIFAQGK